MPGLLFWSVIGVAIALVVIAAVIYLAILLRGREKGTRGIIQRSRLRCPKCGQVFDYDWVPGASFKAVRLGPQRYMACPLCGKWSRFDVYGGLIARVGPGTSPGGPIVPPPV